MSPISAPPAADGLCVTMNMSTGRYRAEGTRGGQYRTVYADSREAVIYKWHSGAPNEWVKPEGNLKS